MTQSQSFQHRRFGLLPLYNPLLPCVVVDGKSGLVLNVPRRGQHPKSTKVLRSIATFWSAASPSPILITSMPKSNTSQTIGMKPLSFRAEESFHWTCRTELLCIAISRNHSKKVGMAQFGQISGAIHHGKYIECRRDVKGCTELESKQEIYGESTADTLKSQSGSFSLAVDLARCVLSRATYAG